MLYKLRPLLIWFVEVLIYDIAGFGAYEDLRIPSDILSTQLAEFPNVSGS